jgi:hypothetical protein
LRGDDNDRSARKGVARVRRAVGRRSRAWHRRWQLSRDRASGRRIVHFLHLGKTGGTAVKAALQPYRRYDDLHLLLHGHSTTLADVPPGDPFFFFLREPLARFVSGFYSRQRQGLPRYHVPWREGEQRAFARFADPEALALGLYDEDAELQAAARDAMTSIMHVRDGFSTWLGSPEAFASRSDDLLLIGFQETLAHDVGRLAERLGLPPLELPRDGIAAHRDPVADRPPLSARARADLERWYAADVEFYADCRRRYGRGGDVSAS